MHELTDEERDLLIDEDKVGNFEYVKGTEEIIEQRRWVTSMSRVYKDVATGKYWQFGWDQPSTENQEYEPDSAYLLEVRPHVKITTSYMVIKK